MTKLGYVEVFNHPLAIALRENCDAITQEYELLLADGFPKPNNTMGIDLDQLSSNGKNLYKGVITSVFTRVAADSCSKTEYKTAYGSTPAEYVAGEVRRKKRQVITKTLEKIIAPYLPYVGTVGFNRMSPPAVLNNHYGMISKYVRFHLGIKCDPGAQFHVNDYAPRAWEVGKVWAFDDGDAFHGTSHTGTTERIILIVDIDKAGFTELSEEERWG
jgi:hypothetical protein